MSDKETQLNIDANTLVDLGKKSVRVITTEDAPTIARPFAVVPEGHEVRDLAAFLPAVEKAEKTFATAEAFAAYVNRFKREATIVFNSLKQGTINAIFDYHTTGTGGDCHHSATYRPDLSPEFIAWKKIIDGGFIAQLAFAEFLDQWGHTVSTPTEAEIKDVVESVQATLNAEAKSVSRTKDGSGGFSHQVKVTLKSGQSGELDIPDQIVIAVPIYAGGSLISIALKLQVRVGGDGVKFRFIAPKLEDMIRWTNEQAVKTVEGLIGATIYAQP